MLWTTSHHVQTVLAILSLFALCISCNENSENSECIVNFTACDGALWRQQGVGTKESTTTCVLSSKIQEDRRHALLLLDATFSDLQGTCECRHWRRQASLTSENEENLYKKSVVSESTDLRPFDWVVFGLVDRAEFTLHHSRCLLASRHQTTRGRCSEHGSRAQSGDGEGYMKPGLIDAILITDREITHSLVVGDLQKRMRAVHCADWNNLNVSKSVVTAAWLVEPRSINDMPYHYIEVLQYAPTLAYGQAWR
jgi:hypothetical protein